MGCTRPSESAQTPATRTIRGIKSWCKGNSHEGYRRVNAAGSEGPIRGDGSLITTHTPRLVSRKSYKCHSGPSSDTPPLSTPQEVSPPPHPGEQPTATTTAPRTRVTLTPTSVCRRYPRGCVVANQPIAFFSPSWRNAFIILTASILIYPYLPSPSYKPVSPSLDPEAFAAARKDETLPALTRWFAKQTEKAEVWTQRNDKHLELTKEAAETKLLFQEGERPKVMRMRYPR